MDEEFKAWLIARGENPNSSQDALSPLRVQYEQEVQLDESEAEAQHLIEWGIAQYGTVAGYFTTKTSERTQRQALDDFAFYMLGVDRERFHDACDESNEQAPETCSQCWEVFWAWVAWINEVSEIHDS